MQPRLIASNGDVGVTYRYSGVDNVALPWTATLLEIKEKIEAVQGEYNYCLLNRYRSGSDSLTVDVISDVICPWCFIGKRRLEKAITSYRKPARVRWHPFQLNPTMPKDGISRRDYRIGKFGSWELSGAQLSIAVEN